MGRLVTYAQKNYFLEYVTEISQLEIYTAEVPKLRVATPWRGAKLRMGKLKKL